MYHSRIEVIHYFKKKIPSIYTLHEFDLILSYLMMLTKTVTSENWSWLLLTANNGKASVIKALNTNF